MLDQSSCLESNPMIRFESAEENASILNYNLPASTSFRVKNYIALNIPNEYWLPIALQQPSKTPHDLLQEPPKYFGTPNVPVRSIVEHIKDRLYEPKYRLPTDPTAPNPVDIIMSDVQELDPGLIEIAAASPGLSILLQLERNLREERILQASGLSTQLRSGTLDSSNFQATSAKISKATFSKYGVTAVDINMQAVLGKLPVFQKTLYGNYKPSFVAKPVNVRQKLVLIEEYEVMSFFGDYGAGKTLKTFSLLPGEKTTISISSNRTFTETKSKTDNILDSYSEDSANTIESMINEETGITKTGTSSEETGFQSTEDWKQSFQTKAEAGGSIKLFSAKASISGSVEHSDQDINTNKTNASRSNTTNAVKKGMDRHVAQSSSARKMEVNTETQQTSTLSGSDETSTNRVLENINRSRVLNFVFRELLQEYLTITYLKDVSFGFTQGYIGDGLEQPLSNLTELLGSIIKPEYIHEVRRYILSELASVRNYEDQLEVFVERVDEKIPDFEDPSKVIERVYFRKKHQLQNEWKGKVVDGIILDVTSRILKTDAVIVEALLGQGEALDCYNMRLQDAAATQANLKNQQIEQALKILEGVRDPLEKAKLYKQVFNDCCNERKQEGGEYA